MELCIYAISGNSLVFWNGEAWQAMPTYFPAKQAYRLQKRLSKTIDCLCHWDHNELLRD